jgi:CelD/BcsL family acetyltransferase involved in cellulose biosynthesis
MKSEPKIIDPKIDKRWDKFVDNHPGASIYHHSSWGDVIEQTYRYHPFYLAFENAESGNFESIVPFFRIDSKLTGKRLISLPFTSYCNPLIENEQLDDAARFALRHHLDINHLELRFISNGNRVQADPYQQQSHFVTHILEIKSDLDEMFGSFHNTSVRHRIKRAERNQLTVRMAEKEQDLKAFYRLTTMTRKKHGLPPQPYRFFANMWKILQPKNLLILPVVEYQNSIIAAAVILKFKDTYYFEYSASDQRFLKLCPNHKLIWESIKLAHKDGAKYFDFGRSSQNHKSLIEFKERWAAKRYDLTYCFYPKAKRINTGGGKGRKILEFVNGHLPKSLLQLEGNLLYPHIG